ncbi:hypothetical protein F5Y10DRAFT_231092 [Nemania abortiva]|nr:hypothetical protein F5Y10DRAFT_231092 [Nemania abortiva]
MICLPLKGFTTRLQRLVGLKSRAAGAATNEKRNSHILHISAPFNFKHESISLPGLSEDDIALLREKAAASRLGVTDVHDDGSSSAFGSPRKAPRAPPSPVRSVAPVLVNSGTTLSPEDNVI